MKKIRRMSRFDFSEKKSDGKKPETMIQKL